MDKQNKNDVNLNRIPSDTCIVCNKRLEEVGGKRIIAQRLRGVIISDQYQEGDQEYPRRSYTLSENPDRYLVIWGEEELWTEDVIRRAKEEYTEGRQSWFCQVCGNRTCKACGSPIDTPMGSTILGDDGSSCHIAILPGTVKCINSDCGKTM